MAELLNDTIFGVKIGTWLIIGGCFLFVAAVFYLVFRKKVNEWIKKHKEIVLYVVFGALTTLVNFIIYYRLFV